MWDWVGGRVSVWSAVGFAAMCAIGPDAFQEFLDGARQIDEHFAQAPLEKNIPVLMALIGVWNANFLGIPTHAVLPYSNALRLLPSYLQQLEMESNGKRVRADGSPLGRPSAPITWGGVGTDAQHAVFQLLHQGTHLVPVDFIASLAPGDALPSERCARARETRQGTRRSRVGASLPPHAVASSSSEARHACRVACFMKKNECGVT